MSTIPLLLLLPSLSFGMELALDTKPAKPGEKSFLILAVQGAEDVGELYFKLSYDWENLKLLGVKPGPLVAGLGEDAIFAMNPEDFPDRSGRFRFDIVVAGGFSGEGPAMMFEFDISDSAEGFVEVNIEEARAVDTSLKSIPVGLHNGGFVLPVSVEEEQVALPPRPALLPNFPNPFNEGTWIPFQVPRTCRVRIKIYNILGQVVRDMDLGVVKGGYYMGVGRAVYWDGRDGDGRLLGSGVYLIKFRGGKFEQVRKALILR